MGRIATNDERSAPRADETPARSPRIAKSSEEVSPRLEMMTTQLDPKQLAGLVAQTAATSAREERATEQIQPIHLQVLRDQAVTELGENDLDPRVVRALLSAAPPEEPPLHAEAEAPVASSADVQEPPIEVRDRRHHGEVAPIAKPPPAALPVLPSPVAWQRMIAIAAVIVAIVVVFALAQ